MMGWGNGLWGCGQGYYGNYGVGNFWWMGLVGMALQVIFGIAVLVIIYRLVRGHHANHSGGHSDIGNDNALNLLSERYAKGEIETEEYTRRKEDLLH